LWVFCHAHSLLNRRHEPVGDRGHLGGGLAGVEGAEGEAGEFRAADELPVWLPTEMRRLGWFLAPKQEKDQDTDDNHQNATDEDQPVWHVRPRSKKAGDAACMGSNMNR